jgi:hypothetical protein
VDLTILAYATLTVSLFLSAVKMGGLLLNADPRSLAHAGGWALLAIVALALGVLLWLISTGRWEGAMMLAAFLLPVFVQAAPRWRALFGALNGMPRDLPPIRPDLGTPSGGFPSAQRPIEPDLVRHAIAVLRAYVEQAALQIEHEPAKPRLAAPGNGSRNGRGPMSTEEALDVLGLPPKPNAQQVREAHRRLEQQLDPDLGGTSYLMSKINEARAVLLGE